MFEFLRGRGDKEFLNFVVMVEVEGDFLKFINFQHFLDLKMWFSIYKKKILKIHKIHLVRI